MSIKFKKINETTLIYNDFESERMPETISDTIRIRRGWNSLST